MDLWKEGNIYACILLAKLKKKEIKLRLPHFRTVNEHVYNTCTSTTFKFITQ